MFKYKNKKTGAVLETPCKISGGNWEKVTTKKGSEKTDKKAEVKVEDPGDE